MKDFLRQLDKQGDSSWLSEWDAAHYNGEHAIKKEILERLKIVLDEKSILTIQKITCSGKQTETNQVRGWMHLWEVADVEKVPFKPENSSLLKDMVAGDQSKPSDNPGLRANGWRM